MLSCRYKSLSEKLCFGIYLCHIIKIITITGTLYKYYEYTQCIYLAHFNIFGQTFDHDLDEWVGEWFGSITTKNSFATLLHTNERNVYAI